MFVLPVSSAFHRRALRGAASPRAFAAWLDARDPLDASVAQPRRDDAEASVPPLDVAETASAYIATLDMPGITREQLEVSVEGRRVVISTAQTVTQTPQAAEGAAPEAAQQAAHEATPAAATDAPRTLHRERTAARYARSFMLPTEVEASAAQARLDNGVLTLTLPKRVAAKVTVQ